MKINVQDREGPVAVASSEGMPDSDEEHGERGKRKLQGKRTAKELSAIEPCRCHPRPRRARSFESIGAIK